MAMTLREAVGTLDGLTIDEVSDKLRAAGVKGACKNVCGCPIANYFGKLTEKLVAVNGIETHYASFEDDEAEGLIHGVYINLSDTLQSWIGNFDDGYLPEFKCASVKVDAS